MKNAAPYSIKNILWVFVLCTLAWFLFQGIVLHRLELEWSQAFVDASISGFLLAGLSAGTLTIYRFYQPGSSNRLYRFIFAIGIAAIFAASVKGLLSFFYQEDTEYLIFLEKSMPIRFITALLVFSFITLLNWMWNILKDQKEQEARKNETEQLLKEAELVRLRQQLQPHFLFNSLNSISALAGSKPNEARKMIQQLSDFLRGTLKKDEKQLVSLREELDTLQLYLEIEKVRFGHRLQINLEASEKCYEAQLPPMLLQPIVENAIKFGLYGTIEAICIDIQMVCENNFLTIAVKNPFDTETKSTSKGSGFGLAYLQRRLFLLFGRNDLILTEKKGKLFIAKLRIPQI